MTGIMIPYLLIFAVGAIVGSFLNVCISRIPRGESIITPPSHCPRCGSSIAWYDNIPLLSYLFLRGRCRHCRDAIALRYPLVEMMTALGAVALYAKFGIGRPLVVTFVFLSCLICISVIDLQYRVIPHIIVLPGIPLFLFAAVTVMNVKFIDAIIGLTSGIGTLYLIAVYYEAITGNEGMGGGDVNLMGLLGAFFGWQGLPIILFCATFIGACIGIFVAILKGHNLKYAIPFGPFLSLGAIVQLFFGRELSGFIFGN